MEFWDFEFGFGVLVMVEVGAEGCRVEKRGLGIGNLGSSR